MRAADPRQLRGSSRAPPPLRNCAHVARRAESGGGARSIQAMYNYSGCSAASCQRGGTPPAASNGRPPARAASH